MIDEIYVRIKPLKLSFHHSNTAATAAASTFFCDNSKYTRNNNPIV